MKFSIVIPNWNGKKLLEKNLPQVLTATEEEKVEVVVVDDGSTDNSVEYLKNLTSRSSMLRIIELEKNFGFSYSCNLGVKKARGEIVILLNNDVVPEKGFLRPLAEDFSDPKIFAVSLNEAQFSWARGEFKNGFIAHSPGPKSKKTHLSFWASGGSAAFRREIWLKLGGFDSLYDPFYWEDIDLSYRAWKRGYKILWEPKSIVHHKHETTISRFSKGYVSLISQRNELLFIWKNIISKNLINEHKKSLVKRLVKNPGYTKVLLAALVKLGQVISQRSQEKKEAKLSDENVFNFFLKS